MDVLHSSGEGAFLGRDVGVASAPIPQGRVKRPQRVEAAEKLQNPGPVGQNSAIPTSSFMRHFLVISVESLGFVGKVQLGQPVRGLNP
jgi:hypothetical protein